MNRTILSLLTLTGLAVSSQVATASLTLWQAEVAAGTVPAATIFTPITSPELTNVGALTGPRAFEFIVNADTSTASSALLGSLVTGSGRQGLKYEQWNNTGALGMTAFGVADFTTSVTTPVGDAHVVFSSDGTDTMLYVNGTLQHTFTGTALAITGEQAIGAARNSANDGYIDVLPGSILGFASYDAGLSGTEVLTHYTAFAAVPEPGSSVLALGALAGLVLRRKRQAD